MYGLHGDPEEEWDVEEGGENEGIFHRDRE